PGSRITMVVVPIVAAHGLAMPKTSSRAITSAAGTADAMETVARVDLNAAEVRRCVKEARACIAWNGLLNHSIIDDVVNRITRSLGLESNRWSVASILSKKLTAGSTHVIIDLPYGRGTKLETLAQAEALGGLFERTGAGLGLVVEALATDGSAPIGRGIGPALEVRDVGWILDGDARAPADLREKALRFASRILAWDPVVGSVEAGRELAERLLACGAAKLAFERIVATQGHNSAVAPAFQTHAVRAESAGRVAGIDGWAVSGIARCAGAPLDQSAGIDLLAGMGQVVVEGDVLYLIHAGDAMALSAAAHMASALPAYQLAPGE
ncbi:MAG: thymidine phosphorylase, partial [Janthinobacterium lividum]